MNTIRFASIALAATFFGATGAMAQSTAAPVTREEVKAELAEAIRTGEILSVGEIGLKMNELYPANYPRQATQTKATRAQVKAERAATTVTRDPNQNPMN